MRIYCSKRYEKTIADFLSIARDSLLMNSSFSGYSVINCSNRIFGLWVYNNQYYGGINYEQYDMTPQQAHKTETALLNSSMGE